MGTKWNLIKRKSGICPCTYYCDLMTYYDNIVFEVFCLFIQLSHRTVEILSEENIIVLPNLNAIYEANSERRSLFHETLFLGLCLETQSTFTHKFLACINLDLLFVLVTQISIHHQPYLNVRITFPAVLDSSIIKLVVNVAKELWE